jgi:hypothetical protein
VRSTVARTGVAPKRQEAVEETEDHGTDALKWMRTRVPPVSGPPDGRGGVGVGVRI